MIRVGLKERKPNGNFFCFPLEMSCLNEAMNWNLWVHSLYWTTCAVAQGVRPFLRRRTMSLVNFMIRITVKNSKQTTCLALTAHNRIFATFMSRFLLFNKLIDGFASLFISKIKLSFTERVNKGKCTNLKEKFLVWPRNPCESFDNVQIQSRFVPRIE